MAKIINLSPHDIRIFHSNSESTLFSSSGRVARCGKPVDVRLPPINGCEVFNRYSPIIGLPDFQEDTYYIVSKVTYIAARDNGRTTEDLLVPDGIITDEKNGVIGCTRFFLNNGTIEDPTIIDEDDLKEVYATLIIKGYGKYLNINLSLARENFTFLSMVFRKLCNVDQNLDAKLKIAKNPKMYFPIRINANRKNVKERSIEFKFGKKRIKTSPFILKTYQEDVILTLNAILYKQSIEVAINTI